jgi:hypothetical protein
MNSVVLNFSKSFTMWHQTIIYFDRNMLQLVNKLKIFMLWWISHIYRSNGMYMLQTICIVWNKTSYRLAVKYRLFGGKSRFRIPGGSVELWQKTRLTFLKAAIIARTHTHTVIANSLHGRILENLTVPRSTHSPHFMKPMPIRSLQWILSWAR